MPVWLRAGGALTLALLAGGSAGVSAAEDAACERDRQRIAAAQSELIEASLKLGLESARLSHQPFTGCLVPGRARTLAVRLSASTPYTLVAVCEGKACRALDMLVLDEARQVVGADLVPGGQPRVDLTPRREGDYLVRVRTPACTAVGGRCSFALGVFVRETPR